MHDRAAAASWCRHRGSPAAASSGGVGGRRVRRSRPPAVPSGSASGAHPGSPVSTWPRRLDPRPQRCHAHVRSPPARVPPMPPVRRRAIRAAPPRSPPAALPWPWRRRAAALVPPRPAARPAPRRWPSPPPAAAHEAPARPPSAGAYAADPRSRRPPVGPPSRAAPDCRPPPAWSWPPPPSGRRFVRPSPARADLVAPSARQRSGSRTSRPGSPAGCARSPSVVRPAPVGRSHPPESRPAPCSAPARHPVVF
mmetsp:Transcript_28342/g.71157  ORF Transcript_28342/g.71157 Transcript_28342/m.71157 type:complete len:252 (-) Transcript_28342:895-1650(-)